MTQYGNSDFYKNLKKPPFQPPSWLFKPVWIVLYLLMFVSLTLIIISPSNSFKIYAYIIFAVQLLLNFSWMPVFFREHKICPAFIVSLLLFLAVLAMVLVYAKISVVAAVLQVPYLIWSLYASAINFYICEVN